MIPGKFIEQQKEAEIDRQRENRERERERHKFIALITLLLTDNTLSPYHIIYHVISFSLL